MVALLRYVLPLKGRVEHRERRSSDVSPLKAEGGKAGVGVEGRGAYEESRIGGEAERGGREVQEGEVGGGIAAESPQGGDAWSQSDDAMTIGDLVVEGKGVSVVEGKGVSAVAGGVEGVAMRGAAASEVSSGHSPHETVEGACVRFHERGLVRLEYLNAAPRVGLLWRADLRASSIVDPRDLHRSADRALIRSAMPSGVGDAAKMMLLRCMAILDEYQRVAEEEVGEVERLKREHALQLRWEEEKWQGVNKKYVEEAVKHQKVNLQLPTEVNKLKDRLKEVAAEKEEVETDARAREELAEKVAGAEFEVTVARQAQKEAEREVTALGVKVRELEGEVKKAIEGGEARVAALRVEHERELNLNVEDFEERLAEAYSEHDSVVAYLEGRIEQAKRLYEAGFVLGFERAQTQVELLVPSFDTGLLDQEKIVQGGVLIPDPEWGFGGVEGEERVVDEQNVGGGERTAEVVTGDVEAVPVEATVETKDVVQPSVDGGQLAVGEDQLAEGVSSLPLGMTLLSLEPTPTLFPCLSVG